MSTKTKELQLLGRTFRVTQLPGWDGHDAWVRLGQVAGPAIAQVMVSALKGLDLSKEGLQKGLLDIKVEDLDLGGVVTAVEMFFGKVGPKESKELISMLLATATVDGSTPVLGEQFNVLFQGETMALYRLVAFAIEVNWGNFSAVIPALGRMGMAHARPSSNGSVQTSSSGGQHGASGTSARPA